MADTKFTPGPWEAHSDLVIAIGTRASTVCAASDLSALQYAAYSRLNIWSTRFHEAIANARLIAAAPDLYAACEACLEFMTQAHLPRENWPDAALVAEAALAKARGEA